MANNNTQRFTTSSWIICRVCEQIEQSTTRSCRRKKLSFNLSKKQKYRRMCASCPPGCMIFLSRKFLTILLSLKSLMRLLSITSYRRSTPSMWSLWCPPAARSITASKKNIWGVSTRFWIFLNGGLLLSSLVHSCQISSSRLIPHLWKEPAISRFYARSNSPQTLCSCTRILSECARVESRSESTTGKINHFLSSTPSIWTWCWSN